jgi:hypothetical protein
MKISKIPGMSFLISQNHTDLRKFLQAPDNPTFISDFKPEFKAF